VGTRAIAAGAAATLALAGCGASERQPPGNDVTKGMSPTAAVEQAFAKLNGRPANVDLTLAIAYEASGTSDQVKQRLAAQSTSGSEHVQVVDANRARATLDIGPIHNGQLVIYDGVAYFSGDGTHYKQIVGALGQTFTSLTSLGKQLSGKTVAGVSYVGYENAGKHYTGMLSPTATSAISGFSLAQSGVATAPGASKIDVWIDPATGLATREKSFIPTTIQISQIAPGHPGTLTIKLTIDTRIRLVSQAVPVQRPPVSGTASSFADLAG
jgi:hypothetical protein